MIRVAKGLMAATLGLVASMLAIPSASAVSPNNLPGDGGISWSDCVYDSPAPAGSTLISTFAHGIKLSCTGVVHIYNSHGFTNDTESCISNTFNHQYSKQTSNTDAGNWVYSALWSAGGGFDVQYYQSFVVVSKSTSQIITAYTDTNTIAGNDSWYTCARVKF